MTAPQPPNYNTQIVDQKGCPTPYFLKMLGQLCQGTPPGLADRVTVLESDVNTLDTNIATIEAQIATLSPEVASLTTTVAGHTTHLAALPTARLTGSATYNPPSLIALATTTTTVTVTGAAIGMAAEASFSLDLTGLVLTAYVDSANSVTVVLFNPTAGAIDLASGTLRAYAWNPA